MADDVTKLIDSLQDTVSTLQHNFMIFRASAQLRLAHLPHVTPWRLVKDAMQRVESKVDETMCNLMSHLDRPESRAGQLPLLLHYGVMGLRAIAMMESKAAFLSTAAVTEKAMCAGPQ